MDTGSDVADRASVRAGTATMVFGMLFLAATAYTYALSLSGPFDPPQWVRMAGLVWLPIGFIATPVAYALARYGPGRHRARIGLALEGAGLLAFLMLLFLAG